MKRIAFSIIAFSISTFGFHSSVSLGQDSPAPNLNSLQGSIITTEPEAILVQSPPPSQEVISHLQATDCADGSCSGLQPQDELIESNGRQRPRTFFDRVRSSRPIREVNSTFIISALLFNRNEGPNLDFSTNSGGELLSSDNTVSDTLGGIDVAYTRRGGNGWGIEARYFGLYPGDRSTQIGNNASSLLTGLSQVGTAFATTGPSNSFLTGPSANSFFTSADTHVLTRQTEINNIEFNFLKNSQPRLRSNSTEFLFGFRYLQFGETLLYEAVDIPQGDPMFTSPSSIGYFSTVENHLLGLQIGGRSDYQLHQRIGLHIGLKAGIFNNNVKTRQRIDYRLSDGSVVTPVAVGGTTGSGESFDIDGERNVKALLGEFDIALSYQVSQNSRFRVGYRVVGVTDIAFASEQIEDNFNDLSAIRDPSTDSDLTLQGTYLGWELAF